MGYSVLILDVFHYTVILFRMFYFSIGDSMASHNGKAFSTKVRDNDTAPSANCAINYKGAWWYHNCHGVNINGLYLGNKVNNTGMRWSAFKGNQSMKTTSIMMRRTSSNN